jgi:hypothetical protein
LGKSIGYGGHRNFWGDLRHFWGEYRNASGAECNFPGGSIEVFCAASMAGMVLRKLSLGIVTAGNCQFPGPSVIVTFWGRDMAS